MSYDQFCVKTMKSWVEQCLKKGLVKEEDMLELVKEYGNERVVPFCQDKDTRNHHPPKHLKCT